MGRRRYTLDEWYGKFRELSSMKRTNSVKVRLYYTVKKIQELGGTVPASAVKTEKGGLRAKPRDKFELKMENYLRHPSVRV